MFLDRGFLIIGNVSFTPSFLTFIDLFHHRNSSTDRSTKRSPILHQKVKSDGQRMLFWRNSSHDYRMEVFHNNWLFDVDLWHIPVVQIFYQNSFCIPTDNAFHWTIPEGHAYDTQNCQ